MAERGLFFEDFRKGVRLKGKVGRTVTDSDNIWFTLLTNNANQIHFNADYARREFPGEPFRGRMVVNGFLTLATVAGILVDQTSASGFMLGLRDVKFLHPVFAGDTIYAECEVVAARVSASIPDSGIVTLRTWGTNQRGEKVLEFLRDFMAKRRRQQASGRPKRKQARTASSDASTS
ncbi:MAG: MaoC family dehydratase [Nitrososphaerota archaeon]|nr:MaoC family dehydratase [Nitrososphaerota archaeon]